MKVRDIIYLLQTRAEPDDEIWFHLLGTNSADGICEIEINSGDCDFEMINRSENHNNDAENRCYISLPDKIEDQIMSLKGKF